ncbi:MAG: TonB system transport protein ExbD [Proteobacteria bacterium]|nr:MAG: TonB system transport protein ExbD [Pseudomonadota bacterium]
MKRFDQINMIPFIDIMLVLLAIVLTTASFVSQGLIDVTLPKAGTVGEAPRNVKPLQISVNADNELFFEEDQVSLDEIGQRLVDIPKDQLIVLRIDKTAVFEHFISLIDLLKQQQFTNLSIQAEKEAR